MGKRTSYEPGTFSWVELSTTDPEAAKAFYGELFGWSAEEGEFPGGGGIYTMAQIDGDNVAGMTAQPEQQRTAGVPPNWFSYVTVASADDAASRAGELGAAVHAGPFDVGEAGRMAVIADPTGAMFGIWQAGDSIGATRVNEAGCLSWNELATNDPAAAQEFYGGLFGWGFEKVDTGPDGVAYWTITREGGGNRNGGLRELTPPEKDVPPNWAAYFGVESADAALAKVEELGGRMVVPAMDVPAGRFAGSRIRRERSSCSSRGTSTTRSRTAVRRPGPLARHLPPRLVLTVETAVLSAWRSAARPGVLRRAVVVAAGMCAFAWSAPVADAAFPGTNGRIALTGLSGGSIWTMTGEGRGLRPVVITVAGATNPSISPDGEEIVFDAAGDIWKAGMNGSTPVNLSGSHDPPGLDADPDWTADGNGIVFTRLVSGASDIYRMDSDGTDPVNLTDTFAGTASQPASGPGGAVVFAAGGDLYSAPSTNITNTPGGGGRHGERQPDVSPSGSLITYQSNTTTGGTTYAAVFTLPGGGGDGTQVTDLAGTGSSGPASFSPDGTKLVFGGLSAGALFTSSLDGSSLTKITGPGKEWTSQVGAADWGPLAAGTETTPPETEITKAPPKKTPKKKAKFEFTGTDNVSAPEELGFECSLDGDDFNVCVSPRTFNGIKKGKHRLEVQAVDFEGNVDPEPDVHRWKVT